MLFFATLTVNLNQVSFWIFYFLICKVEIIVEITCQGCCEVILIKVLSIFCGLSYVLQTQNKLPLLWRLSQWNFHFVWFQDFTKTPQLYAAVCDSPDQGQSVSCYCYSSGFRQSMGRGDAFIQIHTKLSIRLFLSLASDGGGERVVSRLLSIKSARGENAQKELPRDNVSLSGTINVQRNMA